MPDPLSLNVQHLKASETVAISNEAKRRKAAGEDVMDLGVGEPDFDTPSAAAQAGIQAIQNGLTRYPPNVGIAELRRGIAGQLSRMSGGRAIDPDQLVVSSGSKQSIFNACFTLFGPKDRVLIPAPAWVSYPQIVHLCRAEPVLVPGALDWGLKVSARDLDKHSNKATRGLILCSPCNPTGAVYTLAELRSIAEWAAKNDIWIISDEIYRRINYGPGPAPSLLDLPDELLGRVVIIYGASKAYAMTGWRIGAALGPPHLTKAMAALQSHTTTGANQPAQWAAAAAFTDERVDAEVVKMVAAFRRRRDYLVERFRSEAPGVEFVEPHGAFYFFFRVDGIREQDPVTGASFCEQLMQQEGVALVPGAAFADDRWVRLSYAVSDAELENAMDRILRFIQRLASARAA
ncbi:MAG: pyridoxal phosphate-dependent aminotransferase [Gemmatimonadales bacterium]|nr:pyridoxal phosphate-dependent aminotransferase [Gemmatimonadales bacterium]MBA3556115.1 pyridoxal phosphate-dependent aminotransferase [Gemmatimonadales bacterium]